MTNSQLTYTAVKNWKLFLYNQEQNEVVHNNARQDSTHGHHQMVDTEIRLIIFFATRDGEALYSQQKQDLKLTVTQIISFLLQNLGLN